jgi:ketosteroid isomerase-like protein
MTPLVIGREVLQLWQSIFEHAGAFDIQVHHIAWIETADTAIHLIEERSPGQTPGQPGPAIYGTNVFGRGPDGWHLVMHQNSPTPSPPDGSGM